MRRFHSIFTYCMNIVDDLTDGRIAGWSCEYYGERFITVARAEIYLTFPHREIYVSFSRVSPEWIWSVVKEITELVNKEK